MHGVLRSLPPFCLLVRDICRPGAWVRGPERGSEEPSPLRLQARAGDRRVSWTPEAGEGTPSS